MEGTEVPVFPTPTIGMLGIIEDKSHITSLGFKGKSDLIYMLGKSENDISSSEYLASYHKVKESPSPNFDLDIEVELQHTLTKLIRASVIESAHIEIGTRGTSTLAGFRRYLSFSLRSKSIVNRSTY